eukprot:9483310-Pyramimonas_sp.AAC.1
MDVVITDSVNATHRLVGDRTLSGAPRIAVGGKQYLEVAKGCKDLAQWLVGCRQYCTRVSTVVDILMGLQSDASKATLGFDGAPKGVGVSQYRRKMEINALKQLSEGQASDTVDVTLPAFTCDEPQMTVDAVSTSMPFNIKPTAAMVEIRPDVLRWLALKVHVTEKPERIVKRKAAEPHQILTEAGPAVYDSSKGCYVVQTPDIEGNTMTSAHAKGVGSSVSIMRSRSANLDADSPSSYAASASAVSPALAT